jgi:hypothetical protein
MGRCRGRSVVTPARPRTETENNKEHPTRINLSFGNAAAISSGLIIDSTASGLLF